MACIVLNKETSRKEKLHGIRSLWWSVQPQVWSKSFHSVISPFIYILFVDFSIGSYSYNNNIHFQSCSEQDFLPETPIPRHPYNSLTHSLSTFIFHLAIFMHRFNPHIHEIYEYTQKENWKLRKEIFQQKFFLSDSPTKRRGEQRRKYFSLSFRFVG